MKPDSRNRKDINTSIPDGKWWRIPSNQTHADKTKYSRKCKHKNIG